MTNLPISSNNPSPGNAANVLQSSVVADGIATGVQPAEPFAFLLEQQIGETSLSLPAQDAAQFIADQNTANAIPLMKDTQDEAAATEVSGNPSNILAAILMQLPASGDMVQQPNGKQPARHFSIGYSQKTDASQAMPPFADSFAGKTGASQAGAPFVGDFSQRTDPEQQITASVDHEMIQAATADQRTLEAAKRTELPSGLSQQPAQNAAQAVGSTPISAVIPGSPANNATPVGTSPAVTTPLGNSGWAEEFSQKISWITTQQSQVAELRLNPPNLGPLDVVLKISDNQATALFTSPHGAVRDAVENALPKLREILADNGIMLGNTTISDQAPRERSLDEFANQGFGSPAQHEAADVEPEVAESPAGVAQIAPARRHNGMVDTFA